MYSRHVKRKKKKQCSSLLNQVIPDRAALDEETKINKVTEHNSAVDLIKLDILIHQQKLVMNS